MDTEVSNNTSILVVFLYPVVSGPGVAIILVMTLRRKEQWPRLLFFPLLIAAHLVGYSFMVHALGNLRVISGSLACTITSIIAVGTALGLRLYSHRFYQVVGDDPSRRRWFVIGIFLIPLLQVGTVTALTFL